MNDSNTHDKAREGRDLARELEIVRKGLESQSQATLQLASQIATIGARAERMSTAITVGSYANEWIVITPQYEKPVSLPFKEDLPRMNVEALPLTIDVDRNDPVKVPIDVDKNEPVTGRVTTNGSEDHPRCRTRHGIFSADPEELQDVIRRSLRDRPYNVTNYYKKTGVFQFIARSSAFELVSLALVICSSLWMAVDLDYNHAVLLHEADVGFQVVANTICFLFAAELAIRFLAFENLRNIVNDFWCMFDLLLVVVIVVETWVLWFLVATFGFDVSGNNIRVLAVLRMVRLVRVLRLVKLFRFLPELLVIIRGIGIALRAISLVFALLGIIIYMGAIAFRVLLERTAVGQERFHTVMQSMGTLLVECALSGTKGGPLMQETYQAHPIYSFFMFCFALLANVTVMGLLGGLLVQTIKKVAEVEEEEKRKLNNEATVEDFWNQLVAVDSDNDGIDLPEFLRLLAEEGTLKILKKMDVDPRTLVSLSDFMFEENNGRLSREAFNQWVLDLRGTQKGTLKDHYVTRKFMTGKLQQIYRVAAGMDDLHMQSSQKLRSRSNSSIRQSALGKSFEADPNMQSRQKLESRSNSSIRA